MPCPTDIAVVNIRHHLSVVREYQLGMIVKVELENVGTGQISTKNHSKTLSIDPTDLENATAQSEGHQVLQSPVSHHVGQFCAGFGASVASFLRGAQLSLHVRFKVMQKELAIGNGLARGLDVCRHRLASALNALGVFWLDKVDGAGHRKILAMGRGSQGSSQHTACSES